MVVKWKEWKEIGGVNNDDNNNNDDDKIKIIKSHSENITEPAENITKTITVLTQQKKNHCGKVVPLWWIFPHSYGNLISSGNYPRTTQ